MRRFICMAKRLIKHNTQRTDEEEARGIHRCVLENAQRRVKRARAKARMRVFRDENHAVGCASMHLVLPTAAVHSWRRTSIENSNIRPARAYSLLYEKNWPRGKKTPDIIILRHTSGNIDIASHLTCRCRVNKTRCCAGCRDMKARLRYESESLEKFSSLDSSQKSLKFKGT